MLLKVLLLFFMITCYSTNYSRILEPTQKYFGYNRILDSDLMFRNGIQDVNQFETYVFGRESVGGASIKKGLTLQFTLSSDLYQWDRERFSGVARFNPIPEVEIKYVSPWMLNNNFRIVLKLFAYFPMQFYDPTNTTVIENNTANKLRYDEFLRFNELRYEVLMDISPYFSLTWKDSSILSLAIRGRKNMGQSAIIYEATSELYLGKGIHGGGEFRRPTYSKLLLTLEHIWRSRVLPWWLQGFQVYSEYSFILSFVDAMRVDRVGGVVAPYSFRTRDLFQFAFDFKLEWMFTSNIKIAFPAFEFKMSGLRMKPTVDAYGSVIERLPVVADFDIIVTLMF